jgi:lauroyl/myristoyl acyltransferase
MIKAFTEHPRSVGESYWQHMAVALSFAGALAWGALAALAHALLPFLCTRTASDIIARLHGRMLAHRRRS